MMDSINPGSLSNPSALACTLTSGFCGVKYTSADDGTALAYRVEGQGSTNLVLTNGWSTSTYFWKYLYPEWVKKYRVLSWDLRGHGSSESARNPQRIQMATLVDDLSRVMDAASFREGILLGFSMGNQIILEAYRYFPERIRALVCTFGSIEHSLSTMLHPRLGPPLAWLLRHSPRGVINSLTYHLHQIMRSPLGFPLGRALKFYGSKALRDDVQLYIDHFGLLDPPTAAAIVAAGEEHSIQAHLPEINLPVLIFAGNHDIFAPFPRAGKILHNKLPQSRLILLPQGTHTSLFEYPAVIARALDDFIAELDRARQHQARHKEDDHEDRTPLPFSSQDQRAAAPFLRPEYLGTSSE